MIFIFRETELLDLAAALSRERADKLQIGKQKKKIKEERKRNSFELEKKLQSWRWASLNITQLEMKMNSLSTVAKHLVEDSKLEQWHKTTNYCPNFKICSSTTKSIISKAGSYVEECMRVCISRMNVRIRKNSMFFNSLWRPCLTYYYYTNDMSLFMSFNDYR